MHHDFFYQCSDVHQFLLEIFMIFLSWWPVRCRWPHWAPIASVPEQRNISGVKGARKLQKKWWKIHGCQPNWSNFGIYTSSSTTQGGGGSFKHRKCMGEVGCCESRMAERIRWWARRWLELCFLKWLRWSPHHNCWVRLSIYLSVCLSVYLSVCLQVWKRNYSVWLPQFLSLTTSKTKQFYETSSIFEVGIKKQSNSARLPSIMQS